MYNLNEMTVETPLLHASLTPLLHASLTRVISLFRE